MSNLCYFEAEMERNTNTSTTDTSCNSRSATSQPPPPAAVVISSPCAACKILRRRCADKCILAPYFPPTDPAKFTIAHRVFGASNIIKLLQELPETQRADAVASMVYEAGARIRDPVYGSAGAICHLQKQVNELQAQVAKAQADLLNMQTQQANLVAMLCMEMPIDYYPTAITAAGSSLLSDTTSPGSFWDEPLWTV